MKRLSTIALAALLASCGDAPADAPEKALSEQDSATRYARVRIEIDPNPEFPDAFCTPMRVRNENPVAVKVVLREQFRSTDGPGCNGSSTRVLPAIRLERKNAPAGTTQYLGCAVRRTPNMTCTERRDWEKVSVDAQ